MTESARHDLAPTGALRFAVNIGNRAVAHVGADGALEGPAPDLARDIAARLDMTFTFASFASAGAVVAEHDVWDIAFLAVDPARADRLHFTSPYLTIEASVAVRADAPFKSCAEIDRVGVRIASSRGAAYDLHLERTLKNATRETFSSPAESHAAFAAGGFDAVAGVRETLEVLVSENTGYRVLNDSFLRIHHAAATHVTRTEGAALLDAIVASAISARSSSAS